MSVCSSMSGVASGLGDIMLSRKVLVSSPVRVMGFAAAVEAGVPTGDRRATCFRPAASGFGCLGMPRSIAARCSPHLNVGYTSRATTQLAKRHAEATKSGRRPASTSRFRSPRMTISFDVFNQTLRECSQCVSRREDCWSPASRRPEAVAAVDDDSGAADVPRPWQERGRRRAASCRSASPAIFALSVGAAGVQLNPRRPSS